MTDKKTKMFTVRTTPARAEYLKETAKRFGVSHADAVHAALRTLNAIPTDAEYIIAETLRDWGENIEGRAPELLLNHILLGWCVLTKVGAEMMPDWPDRFAPFVFDFGGGVPRLATDTDEVRRALTERYRGAFGELFDRIADTIEDLTEASGGADKERASLRFDEYVAKLTEAAGRGADLERLEQESIERTVAAVRANISGAFRKARSRVEEEVSDAR